MAPTLPCQRAKESDLEPRVAACYARLRALPRRTRRALQRHFVRSLAELALLLVLWQGAAGAALIPVDGTSCTLVNAITAANTDTTTGGCPAGDGADTLILPEGGTITLTAVDNLTDGPTGLPVVTSAITILGRGSTVLRDDTALAFRLLTVSPAGALTVQALTLQNGDSTNNRGGGIFNRGTFTLQNSTLSSNMAGRNGGGVFNLGFLDLVDSTLSNNSTKDDGGGVFNSYGSVSIVNSTLSGNTAEDGGAMFNSNGSVTMANSTLSGNSADDGGGVFNSYGSVSIVNSTLSGNSAYYGGGLLNAYGSVAIANSTLSGNSVQYDGGGVYNYNGSVSIVNSALSGNTAPSVGGAVSNSSYYGSATIALSNSTLSGNSAGWGGGVSNTSDGVITLTNCTLSHNTAQHDGGGIYTRSSILTLAHSTLTGNTAGDIGGGVFNQYGTLFLARTLISGNTASSGAEVSDYDGQGTVTADNSNLFGHSGVAGVDGFSPGATDFTPSVALAAILSPSLTFNGGPTPTHDLVVGSPAADAVTTGGCPASDQRGFGRPAGDDCDVGAVEAGASLPGEVTSPVDFAALLASFITTTDTTGCDGGAGKFTFQAQLTNQPDGAFLQALKAQVAELTNGNLLLTADQTPGGAGALQTLPGVEDFSDGLLQPSGTVTVPFVICLQSLTPFRFTVDLLGFELLP